MTAIFERVLNMSLTGSIVIAVVLLARLLLRRAPKIYSYMLWAVVLFRLLCPISLSAGLSVLKPLPVTTSQGLSTVTYRPVKPVVPTSGEIGQEDARPEPAETVKAKTGAQAMTLAAAVWLTVGGALAGCSLVQYIVLRRKLQEAAPYRGEVYLSDSIATPFVIGVIAPKIYLPSDTPKAERRFIIAHERHHLHRGDPLWKLLGYLALCVHWFNPLVWLAFFLGGKDMEMSCDEAVLNCLGEDIRADYSQALLRLATHKRLIAGMPLAFGEGETKGRVRNMARWRRPKVWVSGICAVLCLVVLAVCALNPQKSDSTPMGAVVTTEKPLNIRAKASASSVVVGRYEPGTAITILERRGGWGRTDRGWIFMDYVTLSENALSGTTGSAIISITGSASIGVWDLYYTLPEGCTQMTVEAGEDRNEQELREGNTVIGGVRAFKIPSDISGADWLEELVFPEWGMENVGYIASGTLASGYTVDFFSDVPEGQPKTLLNRHNVYLWENQIYDVWFNEYTVSPEVENAILKTVSFGSDTAEVSSSVPIDLAMLPESVSPKSGENGATLFVKDGETVGAIDTYDIPDSVENPYADFDWLAEVGVPDLLDPSLTQMGGGSQYGDWEFQSESDVPPGQPQTVNRMHTFFITGRKVYDVWFDLMKISSGEYSNLMSRMVNGEPEETTVATQPSQEGSEYWGESFLSNDGTVSFQAEVYYDPAQLTGEGVSTPAELISAVKREMQAGTMDGFGLGTKEMGYTDVECFVNLTDLVLETRKTDSGEEIPQLIVMGFVIYKFSDGNTIGQELGIHELMALDARDGSFLSGFGRVS